MSITIGNLSEPVYDRLVASLVGGSYKGIHFGTPPVGSVPQRGERPMVVFQLSIEDGIGGVQAHASDHATVTLTITVLDTRENESDNAVGLMGRIYGNAQPSTKTAPTYGFHRHRLTGFRFATGATETTPAATACFRRSEVMENTEEYNVFVGTYTFTVPRD